MEYINIDGDPLSKDEMKTLRRFKGFIKKNNKSGKILLLYRGEKKQNIWKRHSSENEEFNEQNMYQRVFYFGEKSRHFSIDEIDDERSFLLNINDCSFDTLEYIFKRIAHVISNRRSKKRVLDNTPEEFIDYFNNPSNIVDFVSKFEMIKCRSIRLQVRDYYLHWLHMAGAVGIRTETTLVSTSIDKNVALDFSNDKHDKYILHYFIPKPFYHHAVGHLANTIHEFSTTNSGLPNYNSLGLYPAKVR